jgi:hypothetical protein
MSIGNWFKKLFSSSAGTDDPAGTNDMIDINDARINAGGSGIMGVAQHDSSGEEAGQYESGND